MNYTVLSVDPNPRTWNSAQGGPMLAYQVTFTEHPDKSVEWSRKASSEAPQVGQNVDGAIDWTAQYGPRFKQEFAKKDGTWKPRDPDEIAAIQRQHSQGTGGAIAIAIAAGWFEDFDPEDSSGAAKLRLLSRLTDWLQRDIQKGVKLAQDDAQAPPYGQRRRQPELTGQSDVPSSSADFQHEPVPTDSLLF